MAFCTIRLPFALRFALTVASVAGLGSTTLSFSSSPARAAASLGDLSTFRATVIDVKALTDKGDLDGARLRIKDLETAWDDAEAGLKPRDARDWHKVDTAIDKALAALRAGQPQWVDCEATLGNLLEVMDQTGKGG